MGGFCRAIACLGLVAAVATSCGGGESSSTTTTLTTGTTVPSVTSPQSISSTTTTAPSSTSTTAEALTVRVTVSPDHVFVGTAVTFTVEIRGPGTGDSEDVHFGDGGTSGANAGMVKCGDTARADNDGHYEHAYTAPGTYQFTDEVSVIGPPPACDREDVTGTATVLVAYPMQTAIGGVVQSPTGNIACGIYYGSTPDDQKVHCATLSPPQTADMTVSGAVKSCSGSTCNLGNPGFEVPALAYGSATGVGPFLCVSAITGMTCSVTGGRGFTISRAGIELIGG